MFFVAGFAVCFALVGYLLVTGLVGCLLLDVDVGLACLVVRYLPGCGWGVGLVV